jgi:hypothetical protein
VDQVLANQTHDQLYEPRKTNYASIDAWIPGIGTFQMTAARHMPSRALWFVKNQNGYKFKNLYMVPANQYRWVIVSR